MWAGPQPPPGTPRTRSQPTRSGPARNGWAAASHTPPSPGSEQHHAGRSRGSGRGGSNDVAADLRRLQGNVIAWTVGQALSVQVRPISVGFSAIATGTPHSAHHALQHRL